MAHSKKNGTNGAIKIESGIPLPSRSRSELGATLKQLEVGQSFVVPKRPIGGTLTCHAPKKFATRAVEGGFRVWRIA